MANFKDVRKLCLHIVDGVEVDKKLRGENSLGERRINLSYWEWNRYQEIIFCLNCIPSLNAFKSGGGFSGEGCEGRSCSSCILNSGCICGEDSVADTELFCLSNVFFLLGRVINLLGKKRKKGQKKPPPCTSISGSFFFLICPVFLWAIPQEQLPAEQLVRANPPAKRHKQPRLTPSCWSWTGQRNAILFCGGLGAWSFWCRANPNLNPNTAEFSAKGSSASGEGESSALKEASQRVLLNRQQPVTTGPWEAGLPVNRVFVPLQASRLGSASTERCRGARSSPRGFEVGRQGAGLVSNRPLISR